MAPTVDKSGGVPKWVLGLAVGVPLAAGLAYVLFGGPSEESKKKKKKGTGSPKSNKSSPKTAPAKKESASLDPDKITDPLKKAICHKDKGNEYFFQGRYDLAINSYSEAISVCPPDNPRDLSIFHQNRAAAYEQIDKFDLVLKDCDSALGYASSYVKALDRRSKVTRRICEKTVDIDEKIGLLTKSLEDLTALNILNSFNNQEQMLSLDAVIKQIGNLEAGRCVKKPLKPTKIMVKSFFTYFVRDPCTTMGSDLLNGNISNGHVLNGFERALDAFENEEYEHVVTFCDEELRNPESPYTTQAKLMRATMHVITKNVDKAFEDLTDILQDENVDPSYKVNALIKRSYVFIHRLKDPQMDPKLCFEEYEKAEKIQPDNPDIYLHRGQHHILVDNIDMAIRDFGKAVELVPDSSIPRAQKNTAEFKKYSKEGNITGIDKCMSVFEKLVSDYPNCVESHSLYAQALSERQEFDKSISLFKRAQGIAPEDATLYVQEALIILGGQGNVEKAKSIILKALDIDSKSEFAYENLAFIESRMGNHEKALELFDKAISLVPMELELAYLYGQKHACMAQAKVIKRLG